MYRPAVVGCDAARAVDRIAGDVYHPAEHFPADRHRYRFSGVNSRHPAGKPVCRAHGNAPYLAVAELLKRFEYDPSASGCHLHGIEYIRDIGRRRKSYIDYRSGYPDKYSFAASRHKILLYSTVSAKPDAVSITLAVTSVWRRELMLFVRASSDSEALSYAARIAISVAACAPDAASSTVS